MPKNVQTTAQLQSSQFSSVAQSCPNHCDPLSCSMPGLPVQHQLPEPYQTHVHWVGDAMQTSHLLSIPSPPAINLSQYQGLFKWVRSFQMSQVFRSGGQSIGVSASTPDLPMNTQDWSHLGWTGWISLLSKGCQESSRTPQSEASILLCSALFIVQFSHPYMTVGKTIALTRQPLLAK